MRIHEFEMRFSELRWATTILLLRIAVSIRSDLLLISTVRWKCTIIFVFIVILTRSAECIHILRHSKSALVFALIRIRRLHLLKEVSSFCEMLFNPLFPVLILEFRRRRVNLGPFVRVLLWSARSVLKIYHFSSELPLNITLVAATFPATPFATVVIK